MIEETLQVCRQIKPRTPYEVLAYLMEEVGELSSEIMIREGYSRKDIGKDGIIGEAIDVIVCALDIIYLDQPDVTENEIMIRLNLKLAKWLRNRKA